MTRPALRRPFASPGGLAGVLLLAALGGLGLARTWLAPGDPFAIAGPALAPPGGAHPLGTDDLGRDVWTGLVHGAVTSLLVGLSAAAMAGVLGLAVGGLAGLRGGALDHVLMRATEFVQALPRFFLVVTIVSLFGSSLALVVLVLGLTAFPSTARMFRAQVMAVRTRDFVAAAAAAGSRDLDILRRHILPSALPVVAAQVSLQAGNAILAEAGLSFLGLGETTVMSWGTMLGTAQHFVREAWWMSVFPGAAVTLTVLGCNLVADALDGRSR